MSQIGIFTRTSDGFTGHLKTLTLCAELTFVRATQSDAENAPEYRIHLGSDETGSEAGAGWKRTGEKAGDYISVLIDDPALTQPIRANLFQVGRGGSDWQLVWNRPVKRDDRR
ncbi:DUF736 domain-containing protein [Acetobacter sp. DsW_063]|uniref:DUF736 domain-containing protein n=1 Tax=Acetobacter sp. DsW_063 TaxID=1514894 RepID=UPI000A364F25|nr:DUF736 domain-containing protein [Acetobacter sp. DsW_063]OUJ14561.1 hypothetical protein HK28_12945 [Acetobacter sp. DsW_063]